MPHAVAFPMSPCKAEQRSPSQRMPDCRALTSASGIAASSSSLSIEKRGQFSE
jgi:hypothetical protein